MCSRRGLSWQSIRNVEVVQVVALEALRVDNVVADDVASIALKLRVITSISYSRQGKEVVLEVRNEQYVMECDIDNTGGCLHLE